MSPSTVLDPAAASIYQELRSLARWVMRGARSGHTLQPTALVHEAYLKLAHQDGYQYDSRAAFFSHRRAGDAPGADGLRQGAQPTFVQGCTPPTPG